MTEDRAPRTEGGPGGTGSGVRQDLLCLALLAVAVAAFFPEVLRGGVFFVQDVMVQNVPFRRYLHEALAAGRLPLWEPRINAGFPLFAEGQVGSLYPVNVLLAFLVSAARAVTLSVVGHLWLAAAATFLYLRHGLGLGRAAGLTAGLAYGLGGYLAVRAMSPNYVAAAALVPVLFLLVESGLRHGRPARLAVTGLVLALQLLAGHAQAATYGAVAAAAYGLVRAWQLRCWGLALTGAALALPGVLVAAVQVLPTWELAARSARAGAISYQQFVNMSLPPERFLGLLLPDLFGNAATGTYWGGGAGFFIQLCPYVGTLTLALALVGARDGRLPVRGFFAALALAGLALSLGRYTGFFDLLHQVPLLRQFRIPTRFLLWWAFAGAVLAGLGADRLLADREPLRTGWAKVWVLLGAVCIGAVLVNARALGQLPAGGVGGRYRVEVVVDLARALAGLAVAGLVCAAWFRRRPAAPAWTAAAVVVVTWTDLRSFGADFNGTLPASVYTEEPKTAAVIRADLAARWAATAAPGVPPAGLTRIASGVRERPGGLDWHGGWALDPTSYARYPETLRMYSAGLFGLGNTLPGWSPLHPERWWEYASFEPRVLRQANVGYVVNEGPLAVPPGPRLLPVVLAPRPPASGEEMFVYRVRDALPRAWVVPRAVVLPDGEAPRFLHARAFDPRRVVVLAEAPGEPAAAGDASFAPARVELYEPEHVVVELPGTAGYLVLADTYDAGWQVRVDGDARPLLRANHVFRAVPVRAGDRRVEFRYRPASLNRGAWISALAGVVWILGLAWARRRRWPPAAAERDLALGPAALQLALIVVLYGIAVETPGWAAALERLRLPPGFGL